MTICIFDSGVGGLSVLREARVLMPRERFIYVADDAAFPYGDWEDEPLQQRMVEIFGTYIERWHPDLFIIACNTASTLGIRVLREAYPDQIFVGTVPAIKPAAERTCSGLISVLATPGTVKRQYTRDLINQYAKRCDVRLVGSTKLASLAETYLRGGFTDEEAVREEIAPCFVEQQGNRTDIVVLACTHYPFLVNRMRKMAPWPVDWIDTSEAIARRAFALFNDLPNLQSDTASAAKLDRDKAWFSSEKINKDTSSLLAGFGLTSQQ
ncbi:MAG: glutamate racemase [Pseudomonadota bacterium]